MKRKYYMSFVCTKLDNQLIGNELKSDIFIEIDGYLNEKAIKNTKNAILTKYKLNKNTNIIFLNIIDLTPKEIDIESIKNELPFRGTSEINNSSNNNLSEEDEKQIRAMVIESVNGKNVDPVENFK